MESDEDKEEKKGRAFSRTLFRLAASSFKTSPDEIDYLGCGSFGHVRRCYHKVYDTVVAKCYNVCGDDNQQAAVLKNVSREANILSKLYHENIVKVLGITSWKNNIAIIMEYIDGGSLDEFFFSKKILDISLKLGLCVVQQLVAGLDYLHNYQEDTVLCHGDLKPSNVLLTNAFVVKLADFGSANVHNTEGNRGASMLFDSVQVQESSQYTLSHVAPEFLKNTSGPRVPSMDIYSLSMIIYEIFTRKPVYVGANQLPLYTNLLEGNLRPDLHVLDEIEERFPHQKSIFDFLKHTMIQCWDADPERRPKSKEIFQQASTQLKSCNGLEIYLEWKTLSKFQRRKPLPCPSDKTNLSCFDSRFMKVPQKKADAPPHSSDASTLQETTSTFPHSTAKQNKLPPAKQTQSCDLKNLMTSSNRIIQMCNENVDDETVAKHCTEILGLMNTKLPTRNQFPLTMNCIEIAIALTPRSMFALATEFLRLSANLYKLLKIGSYEQQFCLGKMSATCRNLADVMGKDFKDDDVRDNILPLLVGALHDVEKGNIKDAEKINTCHNILKHFMHVCNSIHDYTHAERAAKICQETLVTTLASPTKPNKFQHGQFCDAIGDLYLKMKDNPQALAMYRQAMDNLLSSPNWTHTGKNQNQYIATIQKKIESLDFSDDVFEPEEVDNTLNDDSVINV